MRMARMLIAALLALCAAALVACGDDEEASTTSVAVQGECAEVEAPPIKDTRYEKPGAVLEPGQPARATVETSCGTFVIRLDTKRSPQTTNSFAYLAEQGFYDDTVVHRIAPGYVIQAGDPKGADPDLASTGGPGYTVREPPPQRVSYTKGTVAMGKNEVDPPGTSGSQFFVVTAPADAGLPPDYAILGHVVEGIDVVEEIDHLGDPATEMPLRTVTIDSLTVDVR
jgi:peptidyl-prolyl cis-trans isomerase B (cyclophilin B)